MSNSKLTPSDFANVRPFDSVFKNRECEVLAMRILSFTTEWGELPTWGQYYDTMTAADKAVHVAVKRDFDRVIPYLESPEKAATFSPRWAQLLPNGQK